MKNPPAVQETWDGSLHYLYTTDLYSCLENSMERGAWWAIVHRKELDMTEQLSHVSNTYTHAEEFQELQFGTLLSRLLW